MKKFLKFSSLLLGFSLIAGGLAVGGHKAAKGAKAGEFVASSCDFTTMSSSGSTYGGEWKYGDFTVFGGANNKAEWAYAKFGAKKANTSDPPKVTEGYVITPLIQDSIKRVDIILKASTVGGACTWSVDVASKSDFADAVNVDGGSLDYSKDATISITPATAWAEDSYFKVHLNVTNNTKNNGVVYVEKINFISESEGVTSLDSISCDALSLLPGHSETLDVTYDPESADNKNLSYYVKSGDDVVSVSDAGLVTALKSGSAVITITPEDENASPIDVNVTVGSYPTVEVVEIGKKYIMVADGYELTGISSNSGTSAAYTGSPKGTYLLEVVAGAFSNTVAFKNGDKYLEYHGSDNKLYIDTSVTSSSSWTVATEGDAGIVVRNVADRTRVLSCNTSSKHVFNCYGNLNQARVSFVEYVEGVDLVSFTISSTLDVKVGLTADIAVTYNPANASDKTLTWTSDDESVATVADGEVKGVAEGTTTITAARQGLTSQTCEVTVSKIAQHAGTEADPYTVEDAVAIAKAGTEEMKTGKYIKGLVTKFISGASATSCSFWMGANLEQTSAETGAFEAFKLANISTEEFKLIKVGSTVIVSGNITLYQSKTAETEQGGTLVYNSYAIANEFAKTWVENMATICADTKLDPAGESSNFDLYCEFMIPASSYKNLADDVKAHFQGEGKTGANATDLEKMLSLYDYCMTKYTNLNNFLGREISQDSARVYLLPTQNSDSAITIIVIVSVVSISCLGALILIKRRKAINK